MNLGNRDYGPAGPITSAPRFRLGSAALLAATVAVAAPGPVWKSHVIDGSSQGADGVRLADVNGDGRPDITTGWEQGGTVRVYLHPGPVEVRRTWPAVTVGPAPSVEDAVFVDLDGDGAVDVVSSSEGGTRTMFVHWAPRDRERYLDPAAWRTEPLPATQGLHQWMFCAPAQIDGRHGVDLVAGAKSRQPGEGTIGWLQAPANARDLAAWTWHPLRASGWIMGIEMMDMDGDGDLDVVFTDRFNGGRSGCYWLEHPGPGQSRSEPWREHAIGAIGQDALFFALADIDGDGLQDVCVGTHVGKGAEARSELLFLRRLDRAGTRWAERRIELPSGSAWFKAVSVGDVDLDGRMDLVISFVGARGKPGLLWLSHDGSPFTGRWTAHALSGVRGVKHDLVALIDLDSDGDLDAITTEETANFGVIWYENPTRQP